MKYIIITFIISPNGFKCIVIIGVIPISALYTVINGRGKPVLYWKLSTVLKGKT